jgi:hypothetical protein
MKCGFGSKNDDIQTPDELYEWLDKEFEFDFDPCPYNSDFDGLDREIPWGECNWINPPFSNIRGFLERAVEEQAQGKTSVVLCPARTETKYVHELVFPHVNTIKFLKGRVCFKGFKNALPTSLWVLCFRAKNRANTHIAESDSYKAFSIEIKNVE